MIARWLPMHWFAFPAALFTLTAAAISLFRVGRRRGMLASRTRSCRIPSSPIDDKQTPENEVQNV